MHPPLKYGIFALTASLFGLLVYASVQELALMLAVNRDPELMATKSFQYQYPAFHVLAFVHIVLGLVFLVTGAYQLIPHFRNKYRKFHRLVGKIFFSTGLVVAITAIWMSIFYPYGDYLETLTTLIFGSFILYGIIKAYQYARSKEFRLHRNWVIRVYYIALSVASIRVVATIIIALTGHPLTDVLGLSFVIAFSIHLLLVESWLRWYEKSTFTTLGKINGVRRI
jgi:uncharacterized membrane protein